MRSRRTGHAWRPGLPPAHLFVAVPDSPCHLLVPGPSKPHSIPGPPHSPPKGAPKGMSWPRGSTSEHFLLYSLSAPKMWRLELPTSARPNHGDTHPFCYPLPPPQYLTLPAHKTRATAPGSLPGPLPRSWSLNPVSAAQRKRALQQRGQAGGRKGESGSVECEQDPAAYSLSAVGHLWETACPQGISSAFWSTP